MKETILQVNLLIKEYLPRLNSLLDVSVNLDLTTSNSFEGIRILLEQVDEEMRV